MSTLSVEARPVYRHIVVKRKSAVALAADPVTLQRVRQQIEEVARGVRVAVDADLAHLIKRNHLRNSMKTVYGETADEEALAKVQTYQGSAIIVGTLHKEKVPGGSEPLPATATFWTIKVSDAEKDPQAAFMRGAEDLQRRFQEFSDSKFKLLDPSVAAGVTLVTVAYAPIAAYTGEYTGFEVGMEFHQVTRFGSVDASSFELYSEDGRYPVSPPSDGYMMMLMKSKEAIGDLPGFLTDEQREGIKAYRENKRNPQ